MADRSFGIPPGLKGPVADVAAVFSRPARHRLAGQIAEVERRLPQVSLAVVMMEVAQQIPLPPYAFWLFNRGGLSSALDKGGDNHLVMLLIDVTGNRAAAMVGYGLEPFLQDTELQQCLQPAQQPLRREQYAQAAEAFIRALEHRLLAVHEVLHRQFGLVEEAVWLDASAPNGEALNTIESPY